MTLLRVFKYLAAGVLLVPILIGMIGGISAGMQSKQLKDFCESFPSGTSIEKFRTASATDGYQIFDQSNIRKESIESQIAAKLIESDQTPDQDRSVGVEVIVRKPGIGYYACVVKHNHRNVLATKYIGSD